MTIKSLVGAAAAAAMGLASTPQAHAAVLTQTETFSSVVAMPDDHFFLQPFDTSLGTLTGVTITLTLTGTISLEPVPAGEGGGTRASIAVPVRAAR